MCIRDRTRAAGPGCRTGGRATPPSPARRPTRASRTTTSTSRPRSEPTCAGPAPSALDAYEWGADVGLLERGVDELGDVATGIAFMRGAGRQYDRPWGIDLS